MGLQRVDHCLFFLLWFEDSPEGEDTTQQLNLDIVIEQISLIEVFFQNSTQISADCCDWDNSWLAWRLRIDVLKLLVLCLESIIQDHYLLKLWTLQLCATWKKYSIEILDDVVDVVALYYGSSLPIHIFLENWMSHQYMLSERLAITLVWLQCSSEIIDKLAASCW